jgi:hypothetical protein
MGCTALFFMVWLPLWVAGAMTATTKYLKVKVPGPLHEIDLLCIWAYWLIGVATLGVVIWYFSAITVFTFFPDKLTVRRHLLGIGWTCEFPKDGIARIQQVKDGGENGDNFPSWGLRIEGAVKGRLLWRQPIDRSAWLGPIVAQWAGVSYVSSPRQK